ncbi:hypothetical protein SAMN04515674_105289 [Pseudarcicella hirudinis]|uniref:Uncharacterized protein n=1 Tax=Pseudarcicella hirudinis TaxID=1079859 RepID=A0A1I5SZ99_9BACT|nr:hypothetical protein [Pseudarcicella hirudinis]SFP76048.1 hypothetical protein SAMN04515674_105289 [Pseudarcicella hirudinis]
MSNIAKLPTLQELYTEPEEAFKNDAFLVLMNAKPPDKWVKEHPFIKGHKYIPIDKIEFLLNKIFKIYKIEILREGSSFNGVFVVVRVTVRHPVTGEWHFHDGIGACELQTKKGASAADLASINNGALSMAFPIAKSLAVKDACDHFGSLFGANLNRKDVLEFSPDDKLNKIVNDLTFWKRLSECKTIEEVDNLAIEYPDIDYSIYKKRKEEIKEYGI